MRQWLLGRAILAVLRLLRGGKAKEEAPPSMQPPGQPPPTVERELPAEPRWERLALFALVAAGLCAGGFIAVYAAYPDTQILGITIGGAFLFLAIATIIAGKRLVPQEKVVDDYHEFGDEELQEEVADVIRQGGDGISRRKLLIGAASAAGATTFGAAALVPAASLGPRVQDILDQTPWKDGRRVVDAEGRPLHLDDVHEKEFRTGFPEGATPDTLGAPIILVRVPLDQVQAPPERKAAMPEGVAAYSKICTHAGCAISMYREPLSPTTTNAEPALVCPCHYSTFSVLKPGEVLFGPASRALPQLPLRVGDNGDLIAAGPFFSHIGPTWSGVRGGGPA